MVNGVPMFPNTSAKMAADSNMGFHHGLSPSSSYNRQVASFQPGAMSTAAGMVPGAMNNSGGISGAMGMVMAENPGVMGNASPVLHAGRFSSNILPEPVPGLRCDPGMAVDWSFQEQAILRDGLAKYAGLAPIMKYIKIAATLREKTVRDVAMRCRWMNRKENCKRRKPEEHLVAKKIKDRKEKMVDSSLNVSTHMFLPVNTADYSLMMRPMRPNYQFSSEVPVIDAATQKLMDENAHFLHQIEANFSAFKIQDNVDLFNRLRNNFTNILSSMSEMPGIMRQMPSFPESVNEEPVSALHGANQALMMFGPQGSSPSMQDPTC